MKINENQKVTLTLGQLKRLVKEAVNGDQYQIIWRGDDGYGRKRKFTFTSPTLVDAITRVIQKVNTYLDPNPESCVIVNNAGEKRQYGDDVEVYTVKEALKELESCNGDGCDWIISFTNLTTKEVYLNAGDLEQDDD